MQSYKKNKYDAILHEIFFSNVAKIYFPRVASNLLTCRWQFTNVSFGLYLWMVHSTLAEVNLMEPFFSFVTTKI